MKFAFAVAVVLCLLGFLGLVAADSSGYFVPKAFYKLDADGHKSSVHEINADESYMLKRLRRDSYQSSSSSSSSSVMSAGGQTYFTAHQAVQSSPGIESRFGESPSTGHLVVTSGVIDKDGRVKYQTKHAKL